MKLRLVVSLVLLVLFTFAAPLVWTLLDWPPPRMVLEYGIPPYCAPTGETMEIEGIEFVEIGPGCFRMGSEHLAEGGDFFGKLCAKLGLPWGEQPKPPDEMPVHWVEFEAGFWIARTEVTNEQYERLMPKRERSEYSPGDRHPVVDVSWEDAKAYCEWLAGRSGFDIRLPSEAMWEASCRGGTETEYCFGDDEERLGEYAWFVANPLASMHEVGTRRPNRWGLFDFHGNALEWCEDRYHVSYKDAPSDGSAWTEGGVLWGGSTFRVIRGGGWYFTTRLCRSAIRDWVDPGIRLSYLGFRPACWPSAP